MGADDAVGVGPALQFSVEPPQTAGGIGPIDRFATRRTHARP
jgi:hypothetical protein